MRQWRLIYDIATTGPRNMATDEAILTEVSQGKALPTLRLYQWEPLCLSLGHAQKLSDIDLERLKKYGWGLVRRPTGGRAILHGDELTYSVTLPVNHPLAAGSVIESYRRISEALLAALNLLGAQPHAEKQQKRSESLGPVCFEVPSHYEITVDGRKLIGSAQLRRKEGILQHGTLPLLGDITRICDALAYPDDKTRLEAKAKVRERATTLEQSLGWTPEWNEVAQAIVKGFEGVFEIEFVEGGLSSDEKERVNSLLETVYGPEYE